MVTVEEVVEVLKAMKGAQHVFPLDECSKEGLIGIEDQVKGTLGISCKNLGVEECLKREHVIVIIKDVRFRPPPEPTVLLIADDGMVVGIEIFPHQRQEYEGKDNVLFLSQDFVVFLDKRPKSRECFMMPPVSFPEVANLPGTKSVSSCSPSPPGDMFVRRVHDLLDDPKLASILVGYDDVK